MFVNKIKVGFPISKRIYVHMLAASSDKGYYHKSKQQRLTPVLCGVSVPLSDRKKSLLTKSKNENFFFNSLAMKIHDLYRITNLF